MSLSDGRYFKVSELACHDGTPYPEEFADRLPIVMGLLDAIRYAYGSPIRIVSGYRSPAHNNALIAADEAKGSHQVASGSQHVEGRAADICPLAGPADLAQLWRVVRQELADGNLPELGGLAMYPVSGWIHVDVRPKPDDGHVATWIGT